MFNKLFTHVIENLTVKRHFTFLGYDFAPEEIIVENASGKKRKIVVLVGHRA